MPKPIKTYERFLIVWSGSFWSLDLRLALTIESCARIQSMAPLGRMLRLLTSLIVSRQTFRFVGICMFSMGMKVRIYKVLIIFHISFMGALITKARTMFTMTPEVMVLSIKLKPFSMARMRAISEWKCCNLTWVQFLLRYLSCESVVVFDLEGPFLDLEVLGRLHQNDLDFIQFFLKIIS